MTCPSPPHPFPSCPRKFSPTENTEPGVCVCARARARALSFARARALSFLSLSSTCAQNTRVLNLRTRHANLRLRHAQYFPLLLLLAANVPPKRL